MFSHKQPTTCHATFLFRNTNTDIPLIIVGREVLLMLSKNFQDAMARASTAVPGRVFSVASTPRTLIRQLSIHRLLVESSSIYSSAARVSPKGLQARLPNYQTASSRCGQQTCLPRCSLRSSSFRFSSSSSSNSISGSRSIIIGQVRCFASQSQKTDGLGRSETFKEYRIQQEVEQRRRAIQELEDDLLRSQVEVADARFHLNLQELASLPV
jgi:hypothetical protein